MTGGGARIGKAIALDLGRRGWKVAIQYRSSADSAQQVADQICAAGSHAVALQAHLSDPDAVRSLIPKAAEELGPVNCLINNASLFEHDTVETVTDASWRSHMEVNLHAPLILSQAFAEQPSAREGNVINLLDQRVWKLTPHFLSYTVSKTGLWTLTRTLAMALAPRIRVNAIGPGPTLPSPRQTKEQFERQCAATPLERGATTDEICRAVGFILETPSLTGQMIALDGGQHLAWQTPDVTGGVE